MKLVLMPDCSFCRVTENGWTDTPDSMTETWGWEGFPIISNHPKCILDIKYQLKHPPNHVPQCMSSLSDLFWHLYFNSMGNPYIYNHMSNVGQAFQFMFAYSWLETVLGKGQVKNQILIINSQIWYCDNLITHLMTFLMQYWASSQPDYPISCLNLSNL